MLDQKVQQNLALDINNTSMIKSINLTNMSFDSYIKQLSDDIISLQKK